MVSHVLEAGDPVAHLTVGDLPYVGVELEPGHEPVRLTSTGTSALSERLLALPDRTLTPIGANVPSEASLGAAFDAAVVCQPRVPVTLEPALRGREMTPLPLGAASPAARALSEVARDARAHRLVVVSNRWFQSSAQYAQTVLGLLSSGVVVVADDHVSLGGLLHPDLINALDFEVEAVLADSLVAESVSVRLRRLAWLHHDRILDREDSMWTTVQRPLPSVSVLLATNRPDFIAPALDRIAAQSHADFEVVLALHGVPGDGAGTLLSRRGLEGAVLELPTELPLGVVLNRAASVASGQLVTKWDDDDLYSMDHLVDVCLGLRYSGAELVGKAPEFIYFVEEDTTVLRNHSGYESMSDVIAGGTVTMPRLVLQDIGGFPPLRGAADHYLKKAVLHEGGSIYRMHGFGFVLVRQRHGHTWNPPPHELKAGTRRSWIGIPEVAGVIQTEP